MMMVNDDVEGSDGMKMMMEESVSSKTKYKEESLSIDNGKYKI